MVSFARIDLDGTVITVTQGDFDWPSVAAAGGLGEWVVFPWRKMRRDKKYNRATGEWLDVE